jgi:hypothetical protein
MKQFDYLDQNEIRLLKLFLKRLTFGLVLETTSGNSDKDECYAMIDVLAKVEKEVDRVRELSV